MTVKAARPGPRGTPAVAVRAAIAADLPLLRTWLPPGAATDLPPPGARRESWLVAAAGSRPLACLRLRRAIGLDLPRHWYHVGWVVHAAPELGLEMRRDRAIEQELTRSLEIGRDRGMSR